MTTESLAQYLHERVAADLPIHRVRLHERDDFFAEYWGGDKFFLGLQRPFSAAHRLHAAKLSDAANLALYGKCNNPRGHGHRYLTEATIGGHYDERSGTLYSFTSLLSGVEAALRPWNNKHLDLEAEEFREKPSTGENIVRALWPMTGSCAASSETEQSLHSPTHRIAQASSRPFICVSQKLALPKCLQPINLSHKSPSLSS